MLKDKTKNRADFLVFLFTLGLTAFGILMIFSAGAPYAKSRFDDIYYFVKDQLFAALLGLALMVITSHFSYKFYKRLSWIIFPLGLMLLLFTYVPGIGVEYHESRRWINLGIEFQPSEIYKLAFIIFISKVVIIYKKKERPLIGYIVALSLTICSALIIFFQPHLSCAIIVTLIGFVIIYIGGAKIKYMILTVLPVIVLGLVGAFTFEYMEKRVMTWLDPFAYATDSGYQIIQSLYAIGSGGLFGVGLGKSTQKFLYIPEPQNDFIFSILAEEMGYVGVFIVIFMFCMLLWRGIKIAIYCPDMFGTLLATGITSLIFIQAVLNIAVVTGLVPNTGITLPFFSFGGTSLVMFLIEVGILLNISRQPVDKKELNQ